MSDRHDDVVRRFAEACRSGDIAALRDALDTGAIAVCDGGGRVPAPTVPVHGAEAVADLVAELSQDTELTIEAVNGRTGLALRRAGRPVAVLAVAAVDAKVAVLWIVLNPAKLYGWYRR